MTNRDLLKEAIADAKAVKETAIANAKAALEESFTPHLKSMLAAKLEEMDKDEEVEENVELDEMDAPSFKRKSGASLDPDPKKVGQTTVQEEEEGLEEEELDLDEILNELDLSDEDKEKMNEAEEDEAEEAEEEEAEDEEMEEEEIDLEDMSEDDLKSFIEDVIKDMVEAGELEAGDEMESEDEESEEDMEVEVEDDMEDIMEGEEEVEEGYDMEDMDEAFTTGQGAGEGMSDNALKDLASKFGKDVADYVKANFELGSATKAMASESEIEEAIEEVNKLKAELQEVNLLNAKLLYTNKIFKAKNLTEDKKLRVLKAFDKAETVKEAKVIFETLNEGIESKSTRPTVNANVKRGMASKVTGMVTESKKPIIEVDPMVARWQKLAGLTKE